MSNPAETYESYMVPTLFAPWASHLIQAARPQPGARVLDVACGTGIVARRVAPHVMPGGAVAGIDLNPNMLAVARAAAEREGLAIEWHEGRAERLPFADGSFDLVLCQFGLMFFADPQAALAEMHRVLVVGGRIGVSVWQGLERHPFYQVLGAAIQKRLGLSGMGGVFELGQPDLIRSLLAGAGFADIDIEPISLTARFPNPDSFLAGEIDVDTAAIPSMQHLDAQARRAITEAIREDMEETLRQATEGDQVVIPFHAQVACARRRAKE